MKLIDRYIITRFLSTFLFILGIIITISILIDLVEKMDDFIDKKPPLREIVFVYYLNFIPYWANLLAPVCVCLAVIFFTSRMAQQSELIPLFSSGVSFYRILVPYLLTSIVIAGVAFYLNGYVVPTSSKKRIEFEYKIVPKKKISRDRNIHKKVAPDTYVYINYYNSKKKEGHNFRLKRVKDGDIVTDIKASRMIWVDSTELWQLRRVQRRDIHQDEETLQSYSRLDTTFLLNPDDIFIIENKQETLPLPQLVKYIKLEEMRGSDFLKQLYVERHRRFADPVASIILALIGFAMASRKSRGGTALRIGLGLLICFIFIALRQVGPYTVGEDVPKWIAVWFPNIIFFIISLFLLRIAPK